MKHETLKKFQALGFKLAIYLHIGTKSPKNQFAKRDQIKTPEYASSEVYHYPVIAWAKTGVALPVALRRQRITYSAASFQGLP